MNDTGFMISAFALLGALILIFMNRKALKKMNFNDMLQNHTASTVKLIQLFSTTTEIITLSIIAMDAGRMGPFDSISRFTILGIIEILTTMLFISSFESNLAKAKKDGHVSILESLWILIRVIPFFLIALIFTGAINIAYEEAINIVELARNEATSTFARHVPYFATELVTDPEFFTDAMIDPVTGDLYPAKRYEFSAQMMIYMTPLLNAFLVVYTLIQTWQKNPPAGIYKNLVGDFFSRALGEPKGKGKDHNKNSRGNRSNRGKNNNQKNNNQKDNSGNNKGKGKGSKNNNNQNQSQSNKNRKPVKQVKIDDNLMKNLDVIHDWLGLKADVFKKGLYEHIGLDLVTGQVTHGENTHKDVLEGKKQSDELLTDVTNFIVGSNQSNKYSGLKGVAYYTAAVTRTTSELADLKMEWSNIDREIQDNQKSGKDQKTIDNMNQELQVDARSKLTAIKNKANYLEKTNGNRKALITAVLERLKAWSFDNINPRFEDDIFVKTSDLSDMYLDLVDDEW